MVNKKTLVLFPLITQGIFSVFLPFFDAFNLAGVGKVFLLTSIPAFLLALVCVYYQFHRGNVLQIAFFSSAISFFYTLLVLSFLLSSSPLQQDISLWEHSLALLFYAMMFALPSALYAMFVLRFFLRKLPR